MSEALKTIQAPIATELEYFEKYFRSAMTTDVPLVDRVARYLLKRKGKQMRPMLVLFSAGICGGITPATYRAAALIELLHTATLIHDDVVDEADKRRGMFSINALWDNKAAVLFGDFLLSRGFLLSLEHDDFQLLKIVSTAVKLISEGELLQMEKARRLNIDEAVYLEIIRQKTASLFAACCEVGAASVTDDPEVIERMRLMGEKMGIAFQIKDDLFDYGQDDVGKPRAIDIKERKLTLPFIHTLNKASWAERRKLISTVRHHNTDPDRIRYLIEYVTRNEGLTYANRVMHEYLEEAEKLLSQSPESPMRDGLQELMRYAITRKK